MPTISFNKAQNALAQLRKKNNLDGTSETPKLLTVPGWDKSKVVYKIKDAIERAFKTELERLNDLRNEAHQLQQKRQQLKQKKKLSDSDIERIDKATERIIEINNEVSDIANIEQEVDIDEKLTKETFGDVIDSEIFIDLDFAIDMSEQEENKEES